jgi:hypothetical protein
MPTVHCQQVTVTGIQTLQPNSSYIIYTIHFFSIVYLTIQEGYTLRHLERIKAKNQIPENKTGETEEKEVLSTEITLGIHYFNPGRRKDQKF